ncbi:MAG TPA: ArgE/DapE family deacylase [Ktedonobacteraceae bacterium]|nr:ArgE/DapE family deacylase [Ktedonobacteraceae bacterium]
MTLTDLEQQALAALDEAGLLQALSELLRIPSITGREAVAQRWLGEQMQAAGMEVDLWTLDVDELSKRADFPGMEVERAGLEALGLVGRWQGSAAGRRLIFNGHIDVVPAGDHANWSHDPWGGEQDEEYIYGRGACDMKGGLLAALYAIKAIKASGVPVRGELQVQSVIGEEDGGLGTYATLLRGYTGDAAIVCEPTRLNLIPAQAGALTFTLRIFGKSAHASVRREGVSAIEKYLAVHHELLHLESERNSAVQHPLLGKLELPYPLSIGRVQAGNWSSSVPEELFCEGRIGVAMGESSQRVREIFEQRLRALAASDPWLSEHPLEIGWTGGQFESGEIPREHPLVQLCGECMHDLSGRQVEIEGAPYGSDLRLLVNMGGIPALLFGPGDVRVAHMPDERVSKAEILMAARAYILAALRYLA